MEKTFDFQNLSLYKSLNENPGYLLWQVSIQWRRTIELVLKPLNITQPQFVVLANLAWLTKDGNKINQADISRMTGIDPNTISQILRSLKLKNLVLCTRTVDERSKTPTLTKLGANLLKKALPIVEKADLTFFTQLKQTDILNLIKLFQKLSKN